MTSQLVRVEGSQTEPSGPSPSPARIITGGRNPTDCPLTGCCGLGKWVGSQSRTPTDSFPVVSLWDQLLTVGCEEWSAAKFVFAQNLYEITKLAVVTTRWPQMRSSRTFFILICSHRISKHSPYIHTVFHHTKSGRKTQESVTCGTQASVLEYWTKTLHVTSKNRVTTMSVTVLSTHHLCTM